jgi:hypothetical protein
MDTSLPSLAPLPAPVPVVCVSCGGETIAISVLFWPAIVCPLCAEAKLHEPKQKQN